MTLSREQMEIRKLRIGGSEIGALLGIDPHKTALDVFASKVLPDSELPEPEPWQQWGSDIEAAILLSHARKESLTLEPAPGTITSPDYPALCATPDGIGVRKNLSRVVIEAKNSQWHQRHRWGEPGTDDVPLLYAAQTIVEVGLARKSGEIEETADLVATIGGAPPVAYRIPFDADLFGTLNELAEKFVKDCLLPEKEPDGWQRDRSALEYIKARWPEHNDDLLPATDEAIALVEQLRTYREMERQAHAKSDEYKARLCELIGDKQGIETVCTWKKCKDTVASVTDFQMIALHLAERLKLSAAEMTHLVRAHTSKVVTRQGSRRLRILEAEVAPEFQKETRT